MVSRLIPEFHDYDSMRDDLYELVTDLRLKKFFLAGHSMGGKTAIAFAVKWPEMLNGLIVADISPFTSERTKTTVYNQHLTILRTILSIDLSSIRSRSQAESLLLEKISSGKERAINTEKSSKEYRRQVQLEDGSGITL